LITLMRSYWEGKAILLRRFREDRVRFAAAIGLVADLSRTPLTKRRIQAGCQP
jgi:hypothetical protein